jgi:hypothetical protein
LRKRCFGAGSWRVAPLAVGKHKRSVPNCVGWIGARYKI